MDQSQGTADEAESRTKQNDPIIDVDLDHEDENNAGEKKKGNTSGRKTSFVWDHFIELVGQDDVECKYCKRKMQGNSKKMGQVQWLTIYTTYASDGRMLVRIDLL